VRVNEIPPADLAITLTRPQLLAMLGGAGTNGVQFGGDPKTFTTIAGLTDQPDPARRRRGSAA
jgi:linear primary-alkylsulfatase